LEKEETFERFAVGEGTCDAEAAVENRCEKMKGEIKETGEKLSG